MNINTIKSLLYNYHEINGNYIFLRLFFYCTALHRPHIALGFPKKAACGHTIMDVKYRALFCHYDKIVLKIKNSAVLLPHGAHYYAI